MVTKKPATIHPRKPVKKDNEYFQPDYAVCRSIAHTWYPYDVVVDTKYHEFRVTLQCDRCKTIKKFIINSYGDISKRLGYDYPAGYLAGHRLNANEKRGMNIEFLTQIRKALGK